MKYLSLLISLFFIGCMQSGTTQTYNINQNLLPNELKGLKVYRVAISGESDIIVAVIDSTINSLSYSKGKFSEEVIILNKNSIVAENNSQIIYKKKE